MGPLSILLAEDVPDFRAMLAGALRALGCSVVEVEDGEGAIRALGESSYDIVITDVNMPILGGLEVLAFAKTKHPEMKVFLWTSDPQSLPKTLPAPDGVFEKIFPAIELLEIIRSMCLLQP